MRKKDFEAIAQAINDAREAMKVPGHPLPSHTVQIIDSMARSIAKVCATQNVKFKREAFLAACGVK